ncbi:MAG: MFS transporter [Bryobacteraceae bacterium]
MGSSPTSARVYWRLVRYNRNYRRLWLAQFVSELGDWLYAVAIYALLLKLTGTARSVAIAFVLQVLPQVLVAPSAGILNDRASRKRVMIVADLTRAVIVLLMAVAVRVQSVTFIYALLFLETVMWACFEPGRSAVLPSITTREELVAANALSSITWSTALALGSGLGGALATLLGTDAVFLINSLSFLGSAALLRGMRFEEPHLAGAKPLRPRDLIDFSPMAEGLRYVARDRRLVALLFAKAGLGVLAPHWVLLPIFGERVFPVRAAGLEPARGAMLAMSVLMAARGVGSLLGPNLGAIWVGESHPRLRLGILFGLVLGAAGYFGLAVAPSLWLASASVILASGGGSIGWVFSTTLLQHHTEDRFRGRVFSADFASHVLSMSVVCYLAGRLVDAGMSAQHVALGTGLLAFLPALGWLAAMRLWRRPTPAPPSPA